MALLKAENQKRKKGIQLGRNDISFTHLFFAGDSLLFFKNDNHSLTNIQDILTWYCSLSGQSINLTNSDIYCSPNMADEGKEALTHNL